MAKKTQVQVFEACKAAALDTLWVNGGGSPGVKDPNRDADFRTCLKGSGLESNPDVSSILGYPVKGKLKYIKIAGVDRSVPDDPFIHSFNATDSGSGLGFLAVDDEKVSDMIDSFYGELQ